MAVCYVLGAAVPLAGGASPFAIVADETGARYVFPDGEKSWMGARRIATMSEVFVRRHSRLPATPMEWLKVAANNMSMFHFGAFSSAPSAEEAIAAAKAEFHAFEGWTWRH